MQPQEEETIRHELGSAMMQFVHFLAENQRGSKDDVMRQVATEKYRQAVMDAAARGVEVSICWHTLGVWSEEGKDRIGCFARALDCVRAEKEAKTITDPWSITHTEADCLYEIGRVHAHEGSPEVARRFLAEALPLAQRAELLRQPQHIEDGLEGRIHALLIQLPED